MRLALATGRLQQPGWKWLNARGMVFGAPGGRSLLFSAQPSLEVALVRGRDIPELLQSGVVDVAIVGRDVIEESGLDLSIGESLGFGICRLVFAAPERFRPDGVERLRVATRYPALTRRWAAASGRDLDIVSLQGSVEVAPALGLADAVVDIVETGTTLRSNGLVPLEVLFESYAGLATRAGQEGTALEMVAGGAARRDGMVRAAGDA
ncbi:MAG: ATP phosphoribosyltransferase [Thermaerobacter sp.]|nr:ATP phosphoribosyltransferase [Thermaerobacter sp.]